MHRERAGARRGDFSMRRAHENVPLLAVIRFRPVPMKNSPSRLWIMLRYGGNVRVHMWRHATSNALHL